MLRLTTLGGLWLGSGDGSAAAPMISQRPLALLAFIAAAGERGVNRGRLLGTFWPERDDDHARNCLKQTLFAIRHRLGIDPFRRASGGLLVDARLVTCDSQLFEAAVASGNLESAVDLYRGSYLDGVFLTGLGEFEHWVELQRARLAHHAANSLETLARRAEAAGDAKGALLWWRRLADHDPLSSRIALCLMRAMVAVGERVGALQHAAWHERMLRQELDELPDTEERKFVEQIRRAAQGGPRVRSRTLADRIA